MATGNKDIKCFKDWLLKPFTQTKILLCTVRLSWIWLKCIVCYCYISYILHCVFDIFCAEASTHKKAEESYISISISIFNYL